MLRYREIRKGADNLAKKTEMAILQHDNYKRRVHEARKNKLQAYASSIGKEDENQSNDEENEPKEMKFQSYKEQFKTRKR